MLRLLYLCKQAERTPPVLTLIQHRHRLPTHALSPRLPTLGLSQQDQQSRQAAARPSPCMLQPTLSNRK